MTDDAILLTVAEAAKRLMLSRSKVYELLASGAIDSVTIGRARRIPVRAVRQFIETLEAEQAEVA